MNLSTVGRGLFSDLSVTCDTHGDRFIRWPLHGSTTNFNVDLGRESAQAEDLRTGLAKDAVLVFILAGALGAFYLLVKLVAILAGLPSP